MANVVQTTTANPADVVNRYQTYFSRKLLEPIENTLVLDQFAVHEDLPNNHASKTIRFFRRRQANPANVQALTEGTPITNFNTLESGYIDCPLNQRGDAAKLSDILQWTDIFNWLKQNQDTLIEEAALDFDTISRNALYTGLCVTNPNTFYERFAGVQNTGVSLTDFTTLSGNAPVNSAFDRNSAMACATQLMSHKVPRLNGGYVGVIPPQVMHDARKDPTWLLAATRQDKEALYKHEIISLDGIRYIEGTNPFIEAQGAYNVPIAQTAATANSIYGTIILGRQAFGTPKLAKTTSPMRPQVIINNKPDKADPLNQYTVLGWKAFWGAVALITNIAVTDDPAHYCIYRSKSTFV